jgi:peptidoglycan hydrolase-like protein with peptidoglycan-binding domain
MTLYSYNGWLASPNPRDFGGLDNRVVPGTEGVKLAPGIRKGDVATVLFYVATQLDARVENGDLYTAGDDWGFNFRPNTNDKSTISCHGSATAFDWNATRHPNGRRGTFNSSQVAEIRKILREVDNIVFWGGDFVGTKDEMHFEIKSGVTASQVAVVAAKLLAPKQPKRPILKYGMKDSSGTDLIARVQTYFRVNFPLYAATLPSTGNFLTQTQAVVNEFQKRCGIVADGIIGPVTWERMTRFGWKD